jgi:hypothetical protein
MADSPLIRRVLAFDIGTGLRGSGVVEIESTASAKNPVCAANTRVTYRAMKRNSVLLRGPLCLARTEVVFEGLASYTGGKSVDRTLLWIGRLWETYRHYKRAMVLRQTARAHLVGASKGADAKIKQELRNRFGGVGATDRDVKGTRDKPGPLYGIKADMWSALAVAVAYVEGARQEYPFGEFA